MLKTAKLNFCEHTQNINSKLVLIVYSNKIVRKVLIDSKALYSFLIVHKFKVHIMNYIRHMLLMDSDILDSDHCALWRVSFHCFA